MTGVNRIQSFALRTGSVSRHSAALLVLLTAFLVALPVFPGTASVHLPSSALPAVPNTAPGAALPSASPLPATPVAAIARPANATHTCFKLNATICIEAQNGSYDVIPSPGNVTSSVEPPPNATLNFWVRSVYKLDWPSAPLGESNRTPLRLNVTGSLWNGDQYMNASDGTLWHANPGVAYWGGPLATVQDKLYPFWYTLSIANQSSGVPNFFPGEYVSWHVYIVHKSPTGQYSHFEGPVFHYRISGAWAYSPYPGAVQYAGPSAASLDLAVALTPASPNWNDPIKIEMSTTPADLLNGASISRAYLDLSEYLPPQNTTPGALLFNTTFLFPISAIGSFGAENSSIIIPPSFAQISGSLVDFQITAYDAVPSARYSADQIQTAVYSYVVGGNGSFLSGSFDNDLNVSTTPLSVGYGQFPVLVPDTNVSLLLTSLNSGSAILTAEVRYTFQLPQIHETVSGVVLLHRINSTAFTSRLPSVPLGGYLNFTVLAWDFNNTLETSSELGYSTQTFADAVHTVAPQLAFLWIYLFDNSSGTWVSNASVSVVDPSAFVNVHTLTNFGIAYPNATNHPFTPLLLPSNRTYSIVVSDPLFFPAGNRSPSVINLSLTLRNPASGVQTLIQTDSWTAVESGSSSLGTQLYIWLNTSAPGPTFAPAPPVTAGLVGPGLGLIAGAVAFVPLVVWWNSIDKRRKEQEKKVTL